MYINIDIHVLANVFKFVYFNFELFRSRFPMGLDGMLHSAVAHGIFGAGSGFRVGWIFC